MIKEVSEVMGSVTLKVKGINYFELNSKNGLDWFSNLFPTISSYRYLLDPGFTNATKIKLQHGKAYRDSSMTGTIVLDDSIIDDVNDLYTILFSFCDNQHKAIFENSGGNPVIGFKKLLDHHNSSSVGSPVILLNALNGQNRSVDQYLVDIQSTQSNLSQFFSRRNVQTDEPYITVKELCSMSLTNFLANKDGFGELVKEFLIMDLFKVDHSKHHSDVAIVADLVKLKRSDPVAQSFVATPIETNLCEYCKKPGHFIDNCWKKHPEKKMARAKKARIANDAFEEKIGKYLERFGFENKPLKNCFTSKSNNMFIADSGATNTMINTPLTDGKTTRIPIITANGNMLATSKGNLDLNIDGSTVKLKDVLFCPDLTENLLSIPALTKMGYTVVFRKDNWEAIHCLQEKSFTGFRDGDLYCINVESKRASLSASLLQCADDRNVKINYDNATGIWTATKNNIEIGSGEISTSNLLHDLGNSKLVKESILLNWHTTLNHLSLPRMKELAKSGAINGFSTSSFDQSINILDCEICIKSNLKAKLFPKNKSTPSTRIGQKVHIDGKGPITPHSRFGSRYILTVIDDFSKKRFTKICKDKSEYSQSFIDIAMVIENHCGRPIEIIRSDNEFRTNALKEWCRVKGAVQQFSVPYSPSQNGVAERAIGEEFALVRTLLNQAGLPLEFWEDARVFTDFILDCRLTNGTGLQQTPYEIWYNKKPYLEFMKPFGGKCYVKLPLIANKSLGNRAIEGVYLGPSVDQKGYRVLLKESKQTVISRTVRFISNDCTSTPALSNSDLIIDSVIRQVGSIDEDNNEDDAVSDIVISELDDSVSDDDAAIESVVSDGDAAIEDVVSDEDASIEDVVSDEEAAIEEPLVPDMLPGGFPDESAESATEDSDTPVSSIVSSISNSLGSYWNAPLGNRRGATAKQLRQQALNTFALLSTPTSLKEAMSTTKSAEWRDAVKLEIDSMFTNGVIKAVPNNTLTKGKLISSKLVFDTKVNADGSVERYKARLVAKGFLQVDGVHYFDTHSPVASMNSVKMLTSIVAINDLELHQMDITSAFLIPDLKEELYLKFPNGCAEFDKRLDGKTIWQLKKTLYGLKQSSHEWNLEADKFLKSIGFKHCENDRCIYVRNEPDESLSYIALYVDDLLIANKNLEIVQSIKRAIASHWKARDLGEAKKFLGVIMTRDRAARTVHLSQELLIKECLHEIVLEHGGNMSKCVPVTIPYDLKEKLVKAHEGSILLNEKQKDNYHSLVGKLLYIAGHTRPDLSVSVSMLASYVSNPTEQHWNALKKVLRYCKGTLTDGLVLGGNHKTAILVGYSDSDWSACLDTRRSRSGYTFFLGSGCISHQSKKQSTVALSTCEAEYLGLSSAVVELQWLKRLLSELGFPQEFVEMNQDNVASIHLAEGRGKFSASKHIELRHHKCREVIENGEMKMRWIPTKDMIADILTKPLAKPTFLRLKQKLNIINREMFENRGKESKLYSDVVKDNLGKGAVEYAKFACSVVQHAMSTFMLT